MANITGDGNDNNITGTTGDDSIDGQGGNDTIFGNDGDDAISGGTGQDDLDGGHGSDTIDGGDGDDSIFGDIGNDSIDGGAGNDTLEGDDGADTINGGEGNDSINGGHDSDKIDAGGGDDYVFGDVGDDTVDGGAGHDEIVTDDGNDVVMGRSGNDTIDGGKNDDTIAGGTDDDLMTGGTGADVFVIRDGHGSDTITDFETTVDRVAFDMAEMQSFSDVQSRMTASGSDTIITYDNGDTLLLQNTAPGDFTASNFSFNAGPVCLLKGTLIATPDRPRPIETLRTGDRVVTVDHGAQEILHLTHENMRFRNRNDSAKPVLIKAGFLGRGGTGHRPDRLAPASDTLVGPGRKRGSCCSGQVD